MQAWEYDVIYIDPNDLHQKQVGTPLATRAMNRMGQQGWEAVAMAGRITRRKKAILSGGLHPHYVSTATTMARFTGDALDTRLPELSDLSDLPEKETVR